MKNYNFIVGELKDYKNPKFVNNKGTICFKWSQLLYNRFNYILGR